MLEIFLSVIVLILCWMLYREYFVFIRTEPSDPWNYDVTCKKRGPDSTYSVPYPVKVVPGNGYIWDEWML